MAIRKKISEDAKAQAEAETAAAEKGQPMPEASAPDIEAAKKGKGKTAPVAGDPAPDGPKVAAMTMPDSMPMYCVVEPWRGSIGGTIGTMAKGKVINPRHYGGVEGIKRLMDAGCKLEEMTPDKSE